MMQTQGIENKGAAIPTSVGGLDLLFPFKGKVTKGKEADSAGMENADGDTFVVLLQDNIKGLKATEHPLPQYVEASGLTIQIPEKSADVPAILEDAQALPPDGEISVRGKGDEIATVKECDDPPFPMGLQPIFWQVKGDVTGAESNKPEEETVPMIKGSSNGLSLTLELALPKAGKVREPLSAGVKAGDDVQAIADQDRLRVPGNPEKPGEKMVPEKQALRFQGAEGQGGRQFVRTISAGSDEKESPVIGVEKEFPVIGVEDPGRKQSIRTISDAEFHEQTPAPVGAGVSNAGEVREAVSIRVKAGDNVEAIAEQHRLRAPGNSEKLSEKMVPEKQALRFQGAEVQAGRQFVRTISAGSDEKKFSVIGLEDQGRRQPIGTISDAEFHEQTPAPVGEVFSKAGQGREAVSIPVKAGDDVQAIADQDRLRVPGNPEKPGEKMVPEKQALRFQGAEGQGGRQFVRTISAGSDEKESPVIGVEKEFPVIGVEDQARKQSIRTISDAEFHEQTPVPVGAGFSKVGEGREAVSIRVKAGDDVQAIDDQERLRAPGNPEKPGEKMVPEKQALRFQGAEVQVGRQFVRTIPAGSDEKEFPVIGGEDQGRRQPIRTISDAEVHEQTPAPVGAGFSNAGDGREAVSIPVKAGDDVQAVADQDRLRAPGNPEKLGEKMVPEKQALRFQGAEVQVGRQFVRTIPAGSDEKEFPVIGLEDQGRKQFDRPILAESDEKEFPVIGLEDQARRQFIRTISDAEFHEQTPEPLIDAENFGQEKVFSRNIKMLQEGGSSSDFFPARADVRKAGPIAVDKNKAHQNSLAAEHTDMMAAVTAPLFIKTQNAPTLQTQALLDQVIEQLPQVLGKGGGRIKITLTPPHLGSLDMDVLVRDNRVQVFLTVENRDVQQSLQVHVDKLKEGLQQQGLQMDGLNVLLNDSRHGQGDTLSGGYAFWQDKNHAMTGRKEAEEQVVPSAMASLVQGENRGKVTEGINIFV